jgi:hypothetical protein
MNKLFKSLYLDIRSYYIVMWINLKSMDTFIDFDLFRPDELQLSNNTRVGKLRQILGECKRLVVSVEDLKIRQELLIVINYIEIND